MLTTTRIGPTDRGRSMTLGEFADAVSVPGFDYELGRGIVAVVEVPNPSHARMQHAVLRQLYAYDAANPGVIQMLGPSGSSKLMIEYFESERHPDVAVYKTPSPAENSSVWAIWVPELAIEIVSPDSRDRDYNEKAEEYLHFGIQEYWILDSERAEMLVHRRVDGVWQKQTVKRSDLYLSDVLPGLQFSCDAVFAVS